MRSCPSPRAPGPATVRISVTSRTGSSSTLDGSTTTRRHPCAERAASTYSAPNPGESVPVLDQDCPYLQVPQEGEEMAPPAVQRGTDLRHAPVRSSPCLPAQAVTRDTCRSRSACCSDKGIRAYITT
jgi:hypothetical protein